MARFGRDMGRYPGGRKLPGVGGGNIDEKTKK